MNSGTLDQIFTLVPDAMLVVDAEGRILQANPQAERMFGYASGQLAGMPVEALMPESVRERHHGHRASYVANPRLRPMGDSGQSLIGQRLDGTQFPVEIALSPIRTDQGSRYLASVRDISETQRARQVLVRARYDKLVARVGQLGLAAIDEDEVIASLPAELSAAMAVEAVAIVAHHREQRNLHVRAAIGLNRELDLGTPWTLDERTIGEAIADGATVVVDQFSGDSIAAKQWRSAGFHSSILVPLFDRDRPMGALIAFSARPNNFDHDAMHCLRSVAILLSSLIQRRRTEEQLAHAQRLEAIGQLTGGIAHDFNNLLTVVSGNLQLLELANTHTADSLEFIASAQRAVASGAALTAKLLAFARRQRLTPRSIEPAPLLNELGSMLRRTLGDLVKVETVCAANTSPIYADAAQLESALLNLALNARDAMPRGGNLSIAIHETDIDDEAIQLELAPGRYVVFVIADTGHGMTPEVLARAFEPFFTTKGAGKGNGLGLSMVYGFVRQSGGQVRAESRLGYGSRIELFLPAAAQPAEPSDAPAQPAARCRGEEKILVVEDDPAVRNIAVAFLQSLGYQVRAVADGESALQVLAGDPDVALLFSDVALGTGMTGPELGNAARARRPDLPVLLTSGYEHAMSREGDHGRAHFVLLRKPYRLEELAESVRHHIDGSL